MKKNRNIIKYDWIILFFLIICAIIRWFMSFDEYMYIDYFVSIINLIGLDYSVTNIINTVYYNVGLIIDRSRFVAQSKSNKKRKHKHIVYACVFVLIFYNILHMLVFSCSTGNDMLSMIVLGISLTNNSISSFLVEHIKI